MIQAHKVLEALPGLLAGGEKSWAAAAPFLGPVAEIYSVSQQRLIFKPEVSLDKKKNGKGLENIYNIKFYSWFPGKPPELMFDLPVNNKLTNEQRSAVPAELRPLLQLRSYLLTLAENCCRDGYSIMIEFPMPNCLKIHYVYQDKRLNSFEEVKISK